MTNVELVITGALVGCGYGVLGYKTKADTGENFNKKKFLRTVFLFTVAGAIAGGNSDMQEIRTVVGQIGVLGVVFDMVYGRLKREYEDGEGLL